MTVTAEESERHSSRSIEPKSRAEGMQRRRMKQMSWIHIMKVRDSAFLVSDWNVQ